MANTFGDDPLSGHRADEIGVHRRRAGESKAKWLLPLLAVLVVLALMFLALARRERPLPLPPEITPQGERAPATGSTPTGSKAALPDVPKGMLPELPKGAGVQRETATNIGGTSVR
jgi:hypothetical protein